MYKETRDVTPISDMKGDVEQSFADVGFFDDESSLGFEPSPFNITPLLPQTIEEIHDQRSEKAQIADESFNAPLAPDAEAWAENPDRFDFPGIDTIPRDRLLERANNAAEKAIDRGSLDSVQEKDMKDALGRFTGSPNTVPNNVIKTRSNLDTMPTVGQAKGPVLAHEVGHAEDFDAAEGTGFSTQTGFFESDDPDEELLTEATQLSVRARGGFEADDEYRTENMEIFADAFGLAQTEPRAVKRDAPKLFEKIEEEFFVP